MPLIIDGYNAVFAYRGINPESALETVEESRVDFVEALKRYQLLSREKITVVFDGSREHLPWPVSCNRGNLKILFSGPDENADVLIMELVTDSHGKRRLKVVSSDRQIKNHAMRLGAQTQGTRLFVEKMVRRLERGEKERAAREPREKFQGLAADQIEYWKQLLGFGKDKEEQE